jgi:hypothetical protein
MSALAHFADSSRPSPPCPRSADSVAKRFCSSERARSIQDRAPMRIIDSKIHATRFDCFKLLFHSFAAATFATQSARNGHACRVTAAGQCALSSPRNLRRRRFAFAPQLARQLTSLMDGVDPLHIPTAAASRRTDREVDAECSAQLVVTFLRQPVTIDRITALAIGCHS